MKMITDYYLPEKDAPLLDKLKKLDEYFSKKFQENKFDAFLFGLPLENRGDKRTIYWDASKEVRKREVELESQKLSELYYYYFNSKSFKEIIKEFENRSYFKVEKQSKPDYELLEKLVGLDDECFNKGENAKPFSKREERNYLISKKISKFLKKYKSEGFSMGEYAYFNSSNRNKIKRDIRKDSLDDKVLEWDKSYNKSLLI